MVAAASGSKVGAMVSATVPSSLTLAEAAVAFAAVSTGASGTGFSVMFIVRVEECYVVQVWVEFGGVLRRMLVTSSSPALSLRSASAACDTVQVPATKVTPAGWSAELSVAVVSSEERRVGKGWRSRGSPDH